MIYLDGLNTGTYPAVRDAETHEVRYAKDKSEIPNWARRVEVNGAHILVETYDGRRVSIRGNSIPAGNDDGWYDADHKAFMDAVHDAEAALKRMLAAKGIQVEVEGEREQRELSAVMEQMDDGQTIEVAGTGAMVTRHAGGWVDDNYTPDTFDVNDKTGLAHDKAVVEALFG